MRAEWTETRSRTEIFMTLETSTYCCIVTRSGTGPIALIREQDSFRLPTISLPADAWVPSEAIEVNAQLMDSWGLNCTLLRCQQAQSGGEVLVMEWHPGSQDPERDVTWVDPDRKDLPLLPDELLFIRQWRDSVSNGRVPWENPGWMKDVVLSLVRIFNGVHYPQLTNLAQIKAAWGMSTVMLIETTADDYYFKAGTRQGIDEGTLTQLIHQRFPHYVPNPLIVDETKGWMITRKIANRPIEREDYEFIRIAFRAYGEIQLGCGDFSTSGMAPGIRVRDPNWLQAHLTAFFNTGGPDQFDQLKSRLNDQILSGLRQAWTRQIENLWASELPPGLVQEDFHYGNLLVTLNGPRLIDWADCSITHPFFGYHRTFELWKDVDSESGQKQKKAAMKGYLEAFASVGDADLINREIEMTRPLWKLYQAFRWAEVATTHPGDTYWGRHAAANAARFLEEAIQQA